MRFFVMLGLISISVVGRADSVDFTCASQPQTTSIAVFTKADAVTIRVIHQNGVNYMPLTSRQIITPSDLQNLIKTGEELAQLGNQYDIHVKTSACKAKSWNVIDCAGELQETVNGHHLTWFSLETSQSTIEAASLANPYSRTWVSLAFTMDGKGYEFAMPYVPQDCVNTRLQ